MESWRWRLNRKRVRSYHRPERGCSTRKEPGMKSKLTLFALVAALLVVTLLSAGCAGHRPPRTQADLLELRARQDARLAEAGPALRKQLIAHLKARYDQHPNEPLVVDALIISG